MYAFVFILQMYSPEADNDIAQASLAIDITGIAHLSACQPRALVPSRPLKTWFPPLHVCWPCRDGHCFCGQPGDSTLTSGSITTGRCNSHVLQWRDTRRPRQYRGNWRWHLDCERAFLQQCMFREYWEEIRGCSQRKAKNLDIVVISVAAESCKTVFHSTETSTTAMRSKK